MTLIELHKRFILFFALSCIFLYTSPSSSTELLLKISPTSNDEEYIELIEYLDSISILNQKILYNDDSYSDLLRRECGIAKPALFDYFVKLNKNVINSNDSEKVFKIPSCPYYTDNTTVKWNIGMPFFSFLLENIGYANNNIAKYVADKNNISYEIDENNVFRVSQGRKKTEIALDYSLKPISIKLKKRYIDRIDSIIKNIENFRIVNNSIEKVSEIQYELPVPTSTLESNIFGCTPLSASGNTYFNFQNIEKIIKYNSELLFTGGLKGESVKVVIADSGVTVEDTPFIENEFGEFIPRDDSLSRFNFHISYDDNDEPSLGLNATTGESLPFIRDEDLNLIIDKGKREKYFVHGTHVAGIASGVFDREHRTHNINAPILLYIVNLIHVSKGKLEISNSSLSNAFAYANKVGADIINLSVTTNKKILYLDEFLTLNPKSIIVAAVGNETKNKGHRNLQFYPKYPASQASVKPQIISVAAHSDKNNLAGFSRFGKNAVDIAAPGCDVKSANPRQGALHLSGTSQATPFVSYTVAMLKYFGIRTPSRIKSRLRATVDLSDELKDKVKFGGTLNIENALRVNSDIVSYLKNGSIVTEYGRILKRDSFLLHCTDDHDFTLAEKRGNKVTRITLNESNGLYDVLIRNSVDAIITVQCSLPNSEYRLVESDDKTRIDFSSTSIREIIPAYFK